MKTIIIFFLTSCLTMVAQENNMQLIVKGSFVNPHTNKTVDVESFYMDTYEVTIADFDQFVKATKYKTDATRKGFSICIRDTILKADYRCDPRGKLRSSKDYNYPVMHVSYNDAVAYTQWKKKRLPTEEEWMYVASQKSTGKLKERIWFDENSVTKDGVLDAHPVGGKRMNAFGVYDILGNIEEFVLSTHSRYNVTKGGSFNDFIDHYQEKKPEKRQLVITSRSYSSSRTGFRCVKDLK